jgi:hypothetical protein
MKIQVLSFNQEIDLQKPVTRDEMCPHGQNKTRTLIMRVQDVTAMHSRASIFAKGF